MTVNKHMQYYKMIKKKILVKDCNSKNEITLKKIQKKKKNFFE